MKKLFTLIVICALVTPLFAQQFGKAMFNRHEMLRENGKQKEQKRQKFLGSGGAKYLQLKSANAIKQRLDSVISEGYKEIYRYNAAGQLTYDYYTSNDTAENGTYINMDTYEYDKQGRLSQIEEYNLSEYDGSKYEGNSKTIYTYQDKNNGEFEEYDRQNEVEGWELNGKGTLVFDDAGRLIEETVFSPDGSSGQVVWVNDYKYVTQYHANGEIAVETGYRSDYEGKTWIPSWKDDFTYDQLGRLVQQLSYDWDGDGSTWIPYDKSETVYQKNQTKVSWFDWLNEQWTLENEDIYNLDADGTPTEFVYNDYEEGEILEQEKITLSYNKQYAYADLLLPQDPEDGNDYYGLLMHKMLTNAASFEYNVESKTWEHLGDYTFYYSSADIVSSLSVPIGKTISLYPNPVKSTFSISGLEELGNVELILYSSTGAIAMKQFVNTSQAISVSHLKPGLYVYQLKTQNKVFSGKVVIKK